MKMGAKILDLKNLLTGQIVGRRFGGWAGVSVPLLGAFPGYRRWPIPAPYAPSLEDFARVILSEIPQVMMVSRTLWEWPTNHWTNLRSTP